MLVSILRPFPYAHDGINIRDLAAGAVEDVHGDLVEGLRAEGYVAVPKEADAEPAEAAAEGPAAPPQPPEVEPATAAADEGAAPVAETYPHLSRAQVEALDHVDDGVLKPGGSPKGGNRKRKA